MKDTNKAFLDLVVSTANDLGKHHANETLKLVGDELDTRLSGQSDDLDGVLAVVGEIEAKQVDFAGSIEGLVDSLAHIEKACLDYTKTVADDVADRSVNFRVSIDELKSAINELADADEGHDKLKVEIGELVKRVSEIHLEFKSDIDTNNLSTNQNITNLINTIEVIKDDVDLLHDAIDSNDNINCLADLVKETTEESFEIQKATTDTFEKISKTIKAVKKDVVKTNETVANSAEALSMRINGLHKLLDDAIERVAGQQEAQEIKYGEGLEPVLKDVAEFNVRVDNLKANIVGYGADIARLSTDVHEKIETLDKNDEEFNESLIDIHRLINAAESNSKTLLAGVNDITSALSDQFFELKNESFLSNDKIDMKFAELKLGIVESDIQRNVAVKEVIAEKFEQLESSINTDLAEYRRNIGNQVEASNTLVMQGVDKTLAADKAMLYRAKQWVPGTEYGKDIIVRNLGGVWQATVSTDEEPTAKSNSWICLFSSFYKVTKIKDHHNGVETVFGLHDSLGNVTELTIPASRVRYLKGVHQDHVTYDHLDSIMKDGCRWVATKDNPEGVPGEEDADWQVLTMRGPKGHKGETGERGPKGVGEKGAPGKQGVQGEPGVTPEMDAIVKALVDFESPGDSQAIRRARGHWKLGGDGVPYKPGDVVTLGKGLYLALRPNEGLQTPPSSTEDWLLMLDASSSGGEHTVDTNTAPTYDIEQMPAAEPDVPDNYPSDVDTVAADEMQIRLQVADRAAGNYVVNWHTHHSINATNNSVLTRYSIDGGSSWHESSRESKDVTDELEKYIAFPIVHAGGAVDIVLQMKKENNLNTLIVRDAEIWLDAKFV